MLTLVDNRKTLRIAVTPTAKKVVAVFATKFDMTEQGVGSRLYEWFGGLPEPVQKWVVGLTDGNEGAGMKAFAEALLQPPATFTDVVDEGEDIGKARDRRIREQAAQDSQRDLSVGVIPPPPKKPAKR